MRTEQMAQSNATAQRAVQPAHRAVQQHTARLQRQSDRGPSCLATAEGEHGRVRTFGGVPSCAGADSTAGLGSRPQHRPHERARTAISDRTQPPLRQAPDTIASACPPHRLRAAAHPAEAGAADAPALPALASAAGRSPSAQPRRGPTCEALRNRSMRRESTPGPCVSKTQEQMGRRAIWPAPPPPPPFGPAQPPAGRTRRFYQNQFLEKGTPFLMSPWKRRSVRVCVLC